MEIKFIKDDISISPVFLFSSKYLYSSAIYVVSTLPPPFPPPPLPPNV